MPNRHKADRTDRPGQGLPAADAVARGRNAHAALAAAPDRLVEHHVPPRCRVAHDVPRRDAAGIKARLAAAAALEDRAPLLPPAAALSPER
jgi:hypothetical protein